MIKIAAVVGVSISPHSIKMTCRISPGTFFTKVWHIRVLVVTVCCVHLESQGKSGRSFIKNFEDFEKVLDKKKMLTEQKPCFLQLLTVSSYLFGALAKLGLFRRLL